MHNIDFQGEIGTSKMGWQTWSGWHVRFLSLLPIMDQIWQVSEVTHLLVTWHHSGIIGTSKHHAEFARSPAWCFELQMISRLKVIADQLMGSGFRLFSAGISCAIWFPVEWMESHKLIFHKATSGILCDPEIKALKHLMTIVKQWNYAQDKPFLNADYLWSHYSCTCSYFRESLNLSFYGSSICTAVSVSRISRNAVMPPFFFSFFPCCEW